MALASFNRLQLLGGIAGGDIWSCTFNFATSAGEAVATDEATLTAAAARLKAQNSGNLIGGALRDFMGGAVTLTGFKLSAVTSVAFHEVALAVVTFGTPVLGTNTPHQAPEIAAACSLNSGSADRKKRGRVFWPASGEAVTNGMRFDPVSTAQLATDMAQFISDCGKSIDGSLDAGSGGEPPVGSGALGVIVSKTSKDAVPITQVAVGDVPDVQRRRRNKEKEAYSLAPIPD